MRFVNPLFTTLATLVVLISTGCDNKEKIRLKKIEKGIELISMDVDKLAPDALRMKIQSGVISPEEAKIELIALYGNASKQMEANVQKCKQAINDEHNVVKSGRMIMVDGQLVFTMAADRSKIEQYQQQMQNFGNAEAHYGHVATQIGAFDTSLNLK